MKLISWTAGHTLQLIFCVGHQSWRILPTISPVLLPSKIPMTVKNKIRQKGSYRSSSNNNFLIAELSTNVCLVFPSSSFFSSFFGNNLSKNLYQWLKMFNSGMTNTHCEMGVKIIENTTNFRARLWFILGCFSNTFWAMAFPKYANDAAVIVCGVSVGTVTMLLWFGWVRCWEGASRTGKVSSGYFSYDTFQL